MAWYSAHLITYFKLKNEPQSSFTVWENKVIIEAVSEAEAGEKAEAVGKTYEDGDESLTVDGKAAETVFAGVRKIGTVFHLDQDGKLASGDEISFNSLILPDKESILKLANGEEITVNYIE